MSRILQNVMSSHPESSNQFGVTAGYWFTTWTCLLVAFVWTDVNPMILALPEWYNFGLKLFLFGFLPLLITWIVGSRIGASILDPLQTKTSKRAMLRGVEVALWSLALFAPFFSLVAAIHMAAFEPTPGTSFAVELLKNFFGALLMVFITGLIILGWLIALIGATTGWLLYKFRPSPEMGR